MKTPIPFKKVPLADVTADALNSITDLPWFEGFHAGKHTDMHGNDYEFTRADLQQIVDNFVPGKVPFTTGHPTQDAPAYGYAKSIRLTESDKLYLDGERVNVAFAKTVLSGHYGQRSLGLKKDPVKGWHVYHVAFLGAQEPALDLQPVGTFEFATSTDTHDFKFSIETQTANTLARLMQSLRDFFVSEKGADEANRIVDKWDMEYLLRASIEEEVKDETDAIFSQTPSEDEPMTGITKEQLDAAIAKAQTDAEAKFSKRVEEAEKRADAAEQKAKADAEQAAFTKAKADCDKLIDDQVAKGALTPAQATGLADFMAHLKQGAATEFCFSKGDDEVKQSPFEFAKSFVEGLGVKSPLNGNQQAIEAGNQDLDAKAMQYAKDNNCDYTTAVLAVSGEA